MSYVKMNTMSDDKILPHDTSRPFRILSLERGGAKGVYTFGVLPLLSILVFSGFGGA